MIGMTLEGIVTTKSAMANKWILNLMFHQGQIKMESKKISMV